MALLSGLISYYKFDEPSGTTVTDILGANNLTNVNATVNQAGKINTCYDFNGSSAYFQYASNAFWDGSSARTFSIWVKIGSINATNGNVIFRNFHSTSKTTFTLTINKNSYIESGRERVGIASNVVTSSSTVSLDTWYHIISTWDGSNSELFINNISQGTVGSSGNGNAGVYNGLGFACGIFDSTTDRRYFYDGLTDEFGIWSRVLTSEERATLYNNGNGANILSTTPTIKARPLSETKFINDANLVSYWKFDEASGNASDSKGSNTLVNTNGAAYGAAKFANGINIVGASSQILSISDASQSGLDFSTAMTWSWWQTKADGAYSEPIVKTNATGNQRSYVIQYWNDQKIYVSISSDGTAANNPYWVSTNAISSATGYHHWMVSYNAGVIIVTHNGAVVPGSWSASASTSIYNSTADLVLGKSGVTYYSLSIDDMACFSRALSASEGNELYQGMTLGEYGGAGATPISRPLAEIDLVSDASLLAYWKLDGNSNDSKNTNNGTDTSISYSTTHFGQVASLAKGSKIEIPSQASFNLQSAFTISIWLYPTSRGSASSYESHFLTKDEGGANNTRCFSLALIGVASAAPEGQLYFIYDFAGTSIVSTSVVPLNEWTHVVIVSDQSSYWIYFNGKLDKTGNANITPVATNTKALRVGSYYTNDAYVEALTGKYDDLSIFSKALTPVEVAKLYSSGGTKLLLHLNGNSTDSSGNGNNGTDTAITYDQNNGKFGQGAGFNGSSSRLVLPNLGTSGGSARTVSMWVNIANSAAGQLFYSGNETSLTGFRLLSRSAANGDIQLDFYDRSVTTGAGILPNITWAHVVAVYLGGTISTTTALIYVNGDLIATTLGGGVSGTANTADANYCIGARRNNNDTFINGSVDEVIIENRAWSASEIKKYYTYAKGRFGII